MPVHGADRMGHRPAVDRAEIDQATRTGVRKATGADRTPRVGTGIEQEVPPATGSAGGTGEAPQDPTHQPTGEAGRWVGDGSG